MAERFRVDNTPVWFDYATFSLFTYLVSLLSVFIGKYRHAVARSPYWSAAPRRLERGNRSIVHASALSIVVFLSAIVLFGALVAVYTRGLDPRMTSIINGISYFEASIIFLICSWNLPRWTGKYSWYKEVRTKDAGECARVLRYNVFMGVGKYFARVFCLQMLFFCGANGGMIPISAIAGIALGFVLDFAVYKSRRTEKRCVSTSVTVVACLGLTGGSYVLFVEGIIFIIQVWGVDTHRGENVAIGALTVIYVVVAGAVHGIACYRTWKHKKDLPDDPTSSSAHSGSSRDRMATSLIVSKLVKKRAAKEEEKKAKAAQAMDDMDKIEEGDEDDCDDEDGEAADVAAAAVVEDANEEDGEEVVADVEQAAEEAPSPNEEVINDGDDIGNEDAGPTYGELLCDSLRCCCCKKKKSKEEEDDDDDAGKEEAAEEKESFLDKFLRIGSEVLWALVSLGMVAIVVINIGATQQGNSTKALIGPAQKDLYPPNYNDGFPVCAGDDRGPESTIKSFENKTAAHDEGYKILHCGPCGECSDWVNLRAEWYTRKYLATTSRDCATKSLTGGGQAVHECLEAPPIAFSGGCTDCWVTDVLCAKKFCAFIFIQSNLINTVSNLQVKAGQVTSALCEEANCELENGVGTNTVGFVECSGATRRRMAIKSTIERPKWQQCLSVDYDWNAVFGECCLKTGDMKPTVPKWEELDSNGQIWSDAYGPPETPYKDMTIGPA